MTKTCLVHGDNKCDSCEIGYALSPSKICLRETPAQEKARIQKSKQQLAKAEKAAAAAAAERQKANEKVHKASANEDKFAKERTNAIRKKTNLETRIKTTALQLGEKTKSGEKAKAKALAADLKSLQTQTVMNVEILSEEITWLISQTTELRDRSLEVFF